MDLKILEFNGIRKFYHNQLLTNESKNILNEQWFRFQIIKICEILSIETHDELNISLSNELLCDTIKKKLSRYVDKKIQETNKELLIQYGLDSSNLNNNLPISSKPLTESILNDKDEFTNIQWISWTKDEYAQVIETNDDEESSEEDIDDIFMNDLLDEQNIQNETEDEEEEEEEDEEDYRSSDGSRDESSYDEEEQEDSVINEYFRDSDDMEVVGDCLFQSIASILNELNDTNHHTALEQRTLVYQHYVENSTPEMLNYYIGSLDVDNLLLYTDDEIEELNIDNESKARIIRNKLQSMIATDFENLKRILRTMITNHDYWGDDNEIRYFYNHILQQHNIMLLMVNEDTEELVQYMRFFTLNPDTRFSIIMYTGNHYYNKRYQNGNLIFSREDLGDLFSELENEINENKKIYESYEEYKTRLFQQINQTTNFSIDFINRLFEYIYNYKELTENELIVELTTEGYFIVFFDKLNESQQVNTNVNIEEQFMLQLRENNPEFINKLNEHIQTMSEDSRIELIDMLLT